MRMSGANVAGGTKPRSVAELRVVKLGKPVQSPQGALPAGSSGTVVHAHNDGQAYIVEFYQPFHAVVTVEADAIHA